jgi:tripartite-type tricarboxylate transporter receptor subunit TctC
MEARMRLFWNGCLAALWLLGGVNATAQVDDKVPLKVLVGFPAGGPPDLVARRIAGRLAEQTGRTVTVENRPGASGTIAAAAVASAVPDGNMLLFGVAANLAVAAATLPSLPYQPTRDFTPIVEVARGAYVLLVRSDAPAANLAEFSAWARAKPGQLNYGSPGAGSVHHLAMEMLKSSQRLHVVHIPYRSGMYPALLAGDTHVMFESLPGPLQLIEAGKLRALAVTGPRRLPRLATVPTLGELGVTGMDDVSSWWGFAGPAGMPRPLVDKLNAELRRAMADPELLATTQDWGIALSPGTPEEFGRLIADENRRWKALVQSLGVRLD